MYRLSEFKYVVEFDTSSEFPIKEVWDWLEKRLGMSRYIGPGHTMLTAPWHYLGPWGFQFLNESDYVEFCLRWC